MSLLACGHALPTTTCLVLYVTNDRHFVFSLCSPGTLLLFRHDYKRWDADEGTRPGRNICLADAADLSHRYTYWRRTSWRNKQLSHIVFCWFWSMKQTVVMKGTQAKNENNFVFVKTLSAIDSVCVVMPLLRLGTFHPYCCFFWTSK